MNTETLQKMLSGMRETARKVKGGQVRLASECASDVLTLASVVEKLAERAEPVPPKQAAAERARELLGG